MAEYRYSLYNGRKTYFTLNLWWQDGCRLFDPVTAQPALALWNFGLAEIKEFKILGHKFTLMEILDTQNYFQNMPKTSTNSAQNILSKL
jgi:hypothetical protein